MAVGMNTVYFDSAANDDTRRQQIYNGQIHVFSPRKSAVELCDFARQMCVEAFAPHDPQTAQFHLPVERFAAILAELKPKFIHHPTSKQLIQKLLKEVSCDPAKTYFDVPRLRGLSLGAGPVGLLGAMVLQAQGIETHVFSREAEDSDRAKLVRSFGANYVSAGRTPVDRLSGRIGKIDVVFEAVGVPEVAFGALAALAANGVLILTGVPAERGPVSAELSHWMRDIVLKNQVIFGTVNASRSNYEDAIRRLEQFMVLFPEAVLSLLRRVAIYQAPDMLARGRGIKDVVTLAA